MHTSQSNKSIKSIRLFLCAICSASLVFSCSKKEAEKGTGQKKANSGTEVAETNDNPSSNPESGAAGNVSLDAIDTFIASQEIDKSTANWKTRLAKPPQVEFDATASYYWNLQTNVGMIKVKLNPQVAPMHVSSTIYLTRLGFYDDVVFHRVIKGFMAQGGDPLGRGTGGPGYNYNGEFSPSVRHDRPGLLSMANAGPGTDGSQFFITFVPTPHLDGNHTIFGSVTECMDTVKKLEDRGSRSGQTTEDLRIVKASIEVK